MVIFVSFFPGIPFPLRGEATVVIEALTSSRLLMSRNTEKRKLQNKDIPNHGRRFGRTPVTVSFTPVNVLKNVISQSTRVCHRLNVICITCVSRKISLFYYLLSCVFCIFLFLFLS